MQSVNYEQVKTNIVEGLKDEKGEMEKVLNRLSGIVSDLAATSMKGETAKQYVENFNNIIDPSFKVIAKEIENSAELVNSVIENIKKLDEDTANNLKPV